MTPIGKKTNQAVKISLAIVVVGLVVIFRDIFYADVSAGLLHFSFFAVLVSSVAATVALLNYLHNKKSLADKLGLNLMQEVELSGVSALYTAPPQTMHLINPTAPIDKQTYFSLSLILEKIPDSILLVYHISDSQLKYLTGARTSSLQHPEQVKPGDSIALEVESKIRNCIDPRLPRQCFYEPLSFTSSSNKITNLIFPVGEGSAPTAILALVSLKEGPIAAGMIKSLQNFCDSLAILFSNYRLFNRQVVGENLFSENLLINRVFTKAIPVTPPVMSGFEFAHYYKHSIDIKGDFHLYKSLTANRQLVIIGKSSGQGLEAALFYARLKTMVECISSECLTPADLLNRLSILFSAADNELFATVVALQVQANNNEIMFACAGHSSPVINRPRSGYTELAQTPEGVPLGLFTTGTEPYANQTIQLLPGDGVFLYTDGVIEASGNNKRIGADELKLAIERLDELPADALLENLVNQLIPDKIRNSPEEDYTAIYIKTE